MSTSRKTVAASRPWLSVDRWEESAILNPIRIVVKFARRVARSIAFRARYGPRKVRNAIVYRTRRDVLFPLRNAVLRHKPLAVTAGGQSFLLTPEGSAAFSVWSYRRYEGKFEVEFILSVLQPGMTFFDIGANVGLFSLPAVKKLQKGQVFAFEPSSWTYQRLLQNARLNNLPNLRAVHSALGDTKGEAVLQINAVGKDGLNTLGKPTHEDSDVVATERVSITTLDEFLNQNSISHVDVIKIDTEGAELLVFRGATNLLAKPDAPLILYEGGFLSKGFGYHPVESMWLLQKHGYAFFVMDNNGKISEPVNSHAYDAMVIAVKPAHPAYAVVKERAQ
jgi:FkbM family methyltransferase